MPKEILKPSRPASAGSLAEPEIADDPRKDNKPEMVSVTFRSPHVGPNNIDLAKNIFANVVIVELDGLQRETRETIDEAIQKACKKTERICEQFNLYFGRNL